MGISLVWALIGRLTIVHFLTAFGVIAILFFGCRTLNCICKGIYSTFLGQWLGHTVDLRKMGQWAVVTGATDGIGKAYAEELGSLGINLVLISRNLEKLQRVAKDIADDYKVSTKVIAIDFTGGMEIYPIIQKEIEGLQIGTLINNVGMSYAFPEKLCSIKNGDKFISGIINCNCLAVTLLTYMILPSMVKRKKGVILNVSSFSSLLPIPYMSLYGATKLFEDYFTQALEREYRDSGVVIQSVVPFYVTTNMSKIRKRSVLVPTPKEYVRGQLKTIGLERRTYGCMPHKIVGFIFETITLFIPLSFLVHVAENAFRTSRDKYLHKKKKYADKKD